MIEIYEAIGLYLPAIMGIVTAASVLTAITPSKSDDKYIHAVLKVLNFLALNVFKNKNADAE